MRSVFGKLMPTARKEGYEQRSTVPEVFTEKDVQALLEQFQLGPDHSSGNQTPTLVPAKSNAGLIQTEHLLRNVREFTENSKGRIAFSDAAQNFDIEESWVREMLQSQVLTSNNDLEVISKSEQGRIYDRLLAASQTHFVNTDEFCNKETITSGTLSAILGNQNKTSSMSALSMEQMGSQTYCFSPSLRKSIDSMVTLHTREAIKSNSKSVWKQQDMLGLNTDQFLQVASIVIGKEGLNGSLNTENSTAVAFKPEGYVNDTERQLVDSLLNGSKPYVPLEQLLEDPNHGSDRNMLALLERFKLPNDGSIHVVSKYALSKIYLDQRFSALEPELSERPVNLEAVIGLYPSEVRRDVLSLLGVKVAERGQGSWILGDYLIPRSWFQRMEEKVSELATQLADESWAQDTQLKPKSSALKKQLTDYVNERLMTVLKAVEADVLDLIWKQSSSQLMETAQEAVVSRARQLEAQCDEQFTQLWTSRVVDKVRLYALGVQTLEQGPLRTQLEELLKSHLTTEIIPAAANRAKSKGLMRNTKLKITTRLPKLQTSMTEKKDLTAVLDDVEKFNSQLEIPEYDGQTYQDKKTAHIRDMVHGMRKDQDAPRLFLCLIIVLVATRHDGVLYATGKLAPKLLKMIKPGLEANQAQRLNELKDTIKSGTVTDDIREEMRAMAQTATQT